MDNTIQHKYTSEADEEKVLGSLLYNNSLIPNVANILVDDDFSNDINGKLFRKINKIYLEGKKVDISILSSVFLPEYGMEYASKIAGLTDTVENGRNAESYARIVLDYSQKRKLKTIAEKIDDVPPGLVGNAISEVTSEIVKLQNRNTGERRAVGMFEVMNTIAHQFEVVTKSGGVEIGSKTCFSAWNKILHGIKNELIIIGARPSAGKTACCTSLIVDQAKKNNKVAFFSCEMDAEKIGYRMVAGESGVNSLKIRGGWVKSMEEQYLVCNTIGSIADLPIIIDDQTTEIHDICARATYLVRCEGVKQIYIDHFSCIQNRSKLYSEQEKAKEKMFMLAKLRKTLNVPIIVLFQLTRDAEGKKPKLNDLRETGAAEQDADVIIFLHREREIVEGDEAIKTQFIVAKNRDGAIGEEEIFFYPKTATFKDN